MFTLRAEIVIFSIEDKAEIFEIRHHIWMFDEMLNII